jgi:hypothetical protein
MGVEEERKREGVEAEANKQERERGEACNEERRGEEKRDEKREANEEGGSSRPKKNRPKRLKCFFRPALCAPLIRAIWAIWAAI